MVMHPERRGCAIASLTNTFIPSLGFYPDWQDDNLCKELRRTWESLRDERNANAALIAATPDMELALEDAARLVGLILAGDEAVDTADIEATYAHINTALAKVEGR